jgi:hypothetical protein
LLQLKISYQFTVERHLAVGDKLTGRHGNKGVVTHILETPVHTVILGKTIPIDLMISPSALMGRKNLGQLYEMTHSLLLWGKKENLFDAEEQKQLENVTEDKLLTHGEMAALLSIVKKMAGAERGNATFEIFLLGKSEPFCLAFVGFQHFVRLHHHVKAKLQYRNAKGPHNNRLGQPGSGGGSAGQRLGEMENWSCLSHPIMGDDEDSFNLLFHMRETHGEAKKTRELACSILWSLGYNVTDDAEIQRLDLKSALKPFMELGATYCMIPQEKDLFSIRKEIYSWREQEGTSIARSEIQPERRLACALNPVTSKTHSFGLKELLEKAVDNVVDALGIQVSDLSSRQLETLKNEFAESFGTEILEPQIKSTKDKVEDERLQEFLVFRTKEKAKRNLEAIFLVEGEKIFLPVALDVLYQHTDAANAFLNMVNAFYRFSEALAYGQQLQENALGLVGSIKKPQDPKLQALKPKGAQERFIQGAIITYRNALSGLLKGKMGLLRRHLLGRRLNHSGRGVIVPCPDLELDQVRLPHSLFLGILTNQTRKRLNGGNLEKIDLENLNALLEAKPVWLILIRQPSLHRHNFLTFRASCWDKDAIGIPPFVTLGYNADFDGDTMAIFLPPEPYASNLSHMTLLRNPGFVGTGQLALATGSDLALGWMAIYLKKRGLYKKYIEAAGLGSASNVFLSLGELLGGFFKKNLGNVKNLRKKLLALQQDICRESTGSATMTPAEFEELHKEMKECMGKNRSLSEKDAELKLKEWVEIHHHDSDLARFVHYKVKGGEKELRVMTAFVGEQSDYMKNEPQATFDQSRIDHSFWEGLSDEEMFRYAYASRSAMASKKLDVAQAGHLSYLLAEGLYETRIVEERCDADEGMKIGWEKDTLYVTLNKKDKTSFPLQGYACEKNLAAALGRIAWGRELLRTPKRLLSESDIAKIAVFWTGREGQNREELEEILDEENALWIRSPLTCKTKGGRNVCGACIGADPASRPYDKPTLMTLGSRVGLTAAQSIGERGTQLAMKRFHDTSSTGNIKRGNDKDLNEDSCQAEIGLKSFERIQTSIDVLRSLLINGYDAQGRDFKGYSNTSLKRFTLLIEYVLTESGGGAFEELPQQLIHFELALKAPRGLESWSKEATGRWLSALAYGNITTLKNHAVAESPLCENWGIKSRLMWDAIGA